jgi:hypothetical protein
VKTSYKANNQWAKWVAIADRWKDNPAIRWVNHNHLLENTADSCQSLFATPSAYKDFFGAVTGNVTTAQIDSLWNDEVDSLEATYGVTVDNYCIPYYDDLDGSRGTIKDTIAVWLGERGIPARAKYHETDGPTTYPSSQWYNGGKMLNCAYVTNSHDTLRLRYSDTSKSGVAKTLWQSIFGPMFYYRLSMTGYNPTQAYPTFTWSNYTNYGLYKYEYTGSITGRILVLHFGACHASVDRDCRNVAIIKELGQLIRYYEELAGKDIYRCVSGEELATKWWEQIR